jgi:hypothetical protein
LVAKAAYKVICVAFFNESAEWVASVSPSVTIFSRAPKEIPSPPQP